MMATTESLSDSPEAAIFTTPENDNFYASRPYQPLDPVQQQIQLLKIHPKRLKLAEIRDAFPGWLRKGTDYAKLIGTDSFIDPTTVPKPPYDIPLSIMTNSPFELRQVLKDYSPGYKAAKKEFRLNRPPGFSYIENDKEPRVPCGWAAIPSLSPYKYVERAEFHSTREPGDILLEWVVVDDPDHVRRTHHVPAAYYFVNLHNGDATWIRPQSTARTLLAELYPDGLICCELLEKVPLNSNLGRYAALSYRAGTVQNTRKIMVDGFMFNAFANLEHSLESIMPSLEAPGLDTQLLWTDQICMNQREYSEKALQVGLMRKIFEAAHSVFVVLSVKSTESSDYELARVFQTTLKTFNEQVVLNQDALSNVPATTERAFEAIFEPVESGIAWRKNMNGTLPLLLFLFQLMRSEWWTRAWILQEFIVADRVYVVFGSEFKLPWPAVGPWMYFFCTRLLAIVESWSSTLAPSVHQKRASAMVAETDDHQAETNPARNEVHADALEPLPDPLSTVALRRKTQSQKIMPFSVTVEPVNNQISDLDHTSRTLAESDSLAQRIRSLARSFRDSESYRSSVLHFLERKKNWQGPSRLDVLLQNACLFSATDARDLVYAFIGLADSNYSVGIDYNPSTTVAQVLISATIKLITVDNSLAPLKWAVLRARSRHGVWLPSWAADWTCRDHFHPAYQDAQQLFQDNCMMFEHPKSNAAVAAMQWSDVTANPKLAVRGIRIGKLGQMTRDTYSWSRHFKMGLQRVQTTSQAHVGDEIWVFDGGSAFYVLRKLGDTYSLIHAAGVYFHSGDNIPAQSHKFYCQVVEDVQRRHPEVQDILLV